MRTKKEIAIAYDDCKSRNRWDDPIINQARAKVESDGVSTSIQPTRVNVIDYARRIDAGDKSVFETTGG